MLTKPRRSRGFALIVVLWVLVLIGFLVAHVTASGRTEMHVAKNLYANAAAEAALDGAVSEAVFRISDPRPDQRWWLDGSAHELTIGRSRVLLRIEDEAGRINPNFASPALLQGLLRATGSDAENAKRLAIAIAEWVGPVVGRLPGALADEYRTAGLDYTPPPRPMESLDELSRVLGMPPQVIAAIRPHLSVFAPEVPDPVAADPIVTAALSLTREEPRGRRLSRTPVALREELFTVRIIATANGPDNAEVTRKLVIRLNQTAPQHFIVLGRGPAVE